MSVSASPHRSSNWQFGSNAASSEAAFFYCTVNVAGAQRTGKRVLLDIGGDWCPYCRQMDRFFLKHPDILQLRDQNFITVAVFYSSEDKNEKVLARYSKVLGVPHFYVLDKDGTLLHSQHMLELRAGGSYDPNKMIEFLTKWSPGRVPRAAVE